MTINLAVGNNVRQLQQAGHQPSDALVRAILKHGDAAFGFLLELATNLALFDEDEPACFAPVHALRLLGEMPRVDMIEPLLRQYPLDMYDDDDQWNALPRTWATEAPQMIGKLGAAAIEPLWVIVDSAEWPQATRSIAAIALANAVTMEPTEREALISGLRERLQRDDADMPTIAALGLTSLGVADTYKDVMALFRENKIDKEILTPSVARQLLLSGGEKGLECTKHTLQERYEQHGLA